MAGKHHTPILVIGGQTATGKTSLTLKLAQQFPVEIISADARQVYQEMDIGTGKIGLGDSLSTNSEGTWFLNNVAIHGINLTNPTQVFSSIQFATYASKKIDEIQARGNIPVIVGGTAFYISTLFLPLSEQQVPPNLNLRQKWQQRAQEIDSKEFVRELQQELAQHNLKRLQQMNNSDKHNPRRLMRAIEIAQSTPFSAQSSGELSAMNFIFCALHAPVPMLHAKIEQRVDEMISLGLESEITELLQTYKWSDAGLQTIGYYEWQPYFEEKINHATVRNSIITHNQQYARKQQIFLKRYPFVQWFDITIPDEAHQLLRTCEAMLKKATIMP